MKCEITYSTHSKHIPNLKHAATLLSRIKTMGRRSRSHSRSRSASRAAASFSSSGSRRRRDDASPSRGGGSRRPRSRSRSPPPSSSSRRRHTSSDATGDAPSSSAPSGRADNGGVVRGATVESNGEISMSVEETNRVRAALGLKPLSLGPKKADAAVVSVQKSSAQLNAERERARLQKALVQSKTRRALAHKLAGQSLGEQLQASAAGSALDWVKQSRAAVDGATKTAAEGRKKAAAATSQDAYDASALAGMVVGHDVASFEDGDEVVLTLKDAHVLAVDGHDLNDEQDELVNVELSERDRRLAEQQRAARAALPAYSGYDDDEFLEVGRGTSKLRKAAPARLLAQYDDEADRRAVQQAHKFTLDGSGGSRAAEASAVGGDGIDADGDVAVVSLAMDKSRTIDEFFTQEEIDAQFAKRKGKKLRKKKKPAVDASGEPDGGAAASLMQQLEAEALQNASRDRGRRRRRVEEEDDDGDDSKQSGIEEQNLLRFQEARERANASASSALSAMKKRRRAAVLDDDSALDDAVDLELSASLARTRRIAQLKESGASQAVESGDAAAVEPRTSEDRIAALVNQTIGALAAVTDVDAVTTNTSIPVAVGHVFGASAEGQGATVVFNDATDFESRLRNAMEQRSAQFQAAASGTSSSAAAAASSASAANGTTAERTSSRAAAVDDDEEMKGQSDDEAEEDGGEVWGEEQPLVGAGMAATLALLRKTGDLRETRVERQTGRANDVRERDVDAELRVKDGVKLDYRDEFGRLLTKKEAFRVLSYKFHGHEPGKKKKEKRIKQLKEELAAQKLLSGEGSSKMMKVLEKKQKAAQQAHVVLSGGV